MRTARSIRLLLCLAVMAAWCLTNTDSAAAAGRGQPSDWDRFYHYPYVYYPHNFRAPTQYDHMYYRYDVERRIPVYNRDWHNFYPSKRPYHSGHHFILDVF